MIEINIPPDRILQLKHMVLDYNGTIACDGNLITGVKENMVALAGKIKIHILTADTFGNVRRGLEGIKCELSILAPEAQDIGKLEYVKGLGVENTVCVGNGMWVRIDLIFSLNLNQQIRSVACPPILLC